MYIGYVAEESRGNMEIQRKHSKLWLFLFLQLFHNHNFLHMLFDFKVNTGLLQLKNQGISMDFIDNASRVWKENFFQLFPDCDTTHLGMPQLWWDVIGSCLFLLHLFHSQETSNWNSRTFNRNGRVWSNERKK